MHFVNLKMEGTQVARLNPSDIGQMQERGNMQTLIWMKGDQIPMVIDEPWPTVQAAINDGLCDKETNELVAVADTINDNLVAALKDFKAMMVNIVVALGASLAVTVILILVIVERT